MNTSVCITVLNEESSIGPLLDSLLNQSQKPDEIVIVDGGSKDKTVEIINHYQKRDGRIKLMKEKSSRAKGRNLGIEIAKSEIIVLTDAGCVARPDWLEEITDPLQNKEVDVVSGFYKMNGKAPVQKAMSVFLGTLTKKFEADFLPSARSVAFRKSIWEKVGGFAEGLKDTAEDTVLNYRLINIGARFSRMKTAIVEWGMPENITVFYWKIFSYAKGDAKTKIWFFPGKGFMSHNIKALMVLFRYFIGLTAFIISFWYPILPYLIILIFLYLLWAFRKVYLEFGDWRIAIWGPILQITADLGVMGGFISGIVL